MIWLVAALSRAKVWLYAIAAAVFAGLMGYAAIERRAKRSAQDELAATAAKREAATAKAQLSRVEIKDEVHAQVEQMPAPAADPQTVGSAAAGTPAGELRADWTRDETPGQ